MQLLDGGEVCWGAGARVGPQSWGRQGTTLQGTVELRLMDGCVKVVQVPLPGSMWS